MAGTVVKIGDKVATTTVVNTTTESDLYSQAVPAGSLDTAGRTVRYKVTGDFLNNSGSARTVVFKAYYDDTVVMQTKAISLAADANRRKWQVEIELIAETSSAQRGAGLLNISEPSTDSWATDEASGITATGYGTASESTSSQKNLKLTATLGTANANLEITAKMGHVELLR